MPIIKQPDNQWFVRQDKMCLRYTTPNKSYDLWQYNIYIQDFTTGDMDAFVLCDYIEDRTSPSPEEVCLFELEIGVAFPPVEMYHRFIK